MTSSPGCSPGTSACPEPVPRTYRPVPRRRAEPVIPPSGNSSVAKGIPMAFLRKLIDKLFRRKPKRKNDASIYPMF